MLSVGGERMEAFVSYSTHFQAFNMNCIIKSFHKRSPEPFSMGTEQNYEINKLII